MQEKLKKYLFSVIAFGENTFFHKTTITTRLKWICIVLYSKEEGRTWR